jgi:DNA-directed RNA polymerase specialized sigma subunit
MERTLVDLLQSKDPSPFQVVSARERNRILGQCQLYLTGRQMQLIVLRYGFELTFFEIAIELDVSEPAVWKMHQRILVILKKELAKRKIESMRQI